MGGVTALESPAEALAAVGAKGNRVLLLPAGER